MSERAQQLIEREKELRTGYLDLGNCGLTELPDLSGLEWLEMLVVSNEWWDEKKGESVKSQNSGRKNRLGSPPVGHLPQGLKRLIYAGNWNNIWPVSKLDFLENLASLASLNLMFNKINDGYFLKRLFNLTSLNLSWNEISDVRFLENLTNLTKLNLGQNKISDANLINKITGRAFSRSIGKLRNLTSLNLSWNQISDVRFLENLTNLTELNLGRNKISDWSFFEDLTKLTSLNLSWNQISDVRFLENLTNLTKLNLGQNKINDGYFLENLINLTLLDLSSSQIIDWSFLEKLTTLTSLSLNGNQISDVHFLENLNNLAELNLYNNQINDVHFLEDLTKLTELNLGRNQINDVRFLGNLTKLTNLNLGRNEISDVRFLENLTKLIKLNLSQNQISDWSFLEKLTNLTSLDLSGNQINDVRFLGNLTKLTELNLGGNQINDVRFLGNLTKLTELNLWNNQISDLKPLLHLIQKGVPITVEQYIEGINIDNNPITNPPLDIVRQGTPAILEYFRQKEAAGAELLLEAKLILLGDGRAGKTSLANRLLGKDLPAEADRTQGVDIIIGEYEFPVAGGGAFKLNIWDFAGQDKYKPLHQFFYTESSLYVMVAESGNSGTDYDDWFQTAELFGEGSPLLLALNEFRDGTGLGSFDVERWKKRFPNLLKEVFSVNLGTQRGMEELRQHIHLLAQTLPHTRHEFPKNWAAVRRELESRRSEHFISLQEYLRICRENQLPERDSALILSSVLHKIGVCLHYQKSELLRQFVILNNEWATGAVYKILEDPVVAETKRGFFDWDDLRRIWHEAAYCDMQPQLLELMQQFKMAYPLPNGKEYVAPPLLSPAPPESWEWPAGESLAMYVEYEFMPKLLMTQFIVSRYMDIAEGRTQVWRNGVALRWPAALAEVVKSKSQGRDAFLIRVQGKGGKGLLTAIRNTLRDLHDEYRGIRPHEIIPCPCSGCRSGKNRQHYFDYENLQNRLEKGRRVVECDKSLEELNLLELLGALFVFDSLEVGRPPRMREVASPAALERQGLEEQLNLTIQKLSRIREALAIENDPSAKFKYEKQIESLELEIAEVRQKLRGMNG